MIMITFLLCAIPTALGLATFTSSSSRHHQLLPSERRSRRHNSPPRSELAPARRRHPSVGATRLHNLYDDWCDDLISSSRSDYTYDDLILPLEEEYIEQCLEEFVDSDYGKTMFGKHDGPASVGITGSIEFDSLEGPEAILSLTGKFWHRRDTVLGKAAMYLNARIPELSSVFVSSSEELADFEDIVDEYTGAVVAREDKRAPDFNGDRETMEYQGLDPDARGPFVSAFGKGGSMIRPA